MAVLARHHLGQFGAGNGHAQALSDPAQELHAACLMADMARQQRGRRGGLTQVMHQTSPAHVQRCCYCGGLLQHHHQVHTRVNFRVVFSALRHTPQGIDIRQQHLQSTACAQNIHHARGVRLHQTGRQFSPHPLRHQGCSFTVADHLAHQHGGCWGRLKVREPGCEACQTQDANRVFAKGIGAVAQGAGTQVSHTAKGVHNRGRVKAAVGAYVRSGNRHRVDGQVTPSQVLLQGD